RSRRPRSSSRPTTARSSRGSGCRRTAASSSADDGGKPRALRSRDLDPAPDRRRGPRAALPPRRGRRRALAAVSGASRQARHRLPQPDGGARPGAARPVGGDAGPSVPAGHGRRAGELESAPLRPGPPAPARADHRPDAPLLGRPRPSRAAHSLRRGVGDRNPGGAPAGVRGLRPRAPPRRAGGGGGGGHRVLPSRGGSIVKFYYFHLMPYVLNHEEPSSWVTFSNRHYDPKVGQQLYNQYLDQLEYAETLGWDGLCVNEHH